MKTIPAGEFKSKCLQLMDKVQRTRRPITITKRGKPVAKLVPVEQEQDEWFGRLRGEMKIVGDIVSPIDPPEAWESTR
ncbi:MAG TPA: type II toxin-antitoxin system Phd/YefM family antitoxin [Terriglobales bacterium]|nr:type II toxin-antitoxin system Phd/YefM family antitoxin [Terriglobales bacterium]